MNREQPWLTILTDHLQTLIDHPTSRWGGTPQGLWMSALRPGTFDYPPETEKPRVGDDAPMQPGCTVLPGNRAYRCIHAPSGCSPYWDLPMMAAAAQIRQRTGQAHYAEAAETYLKSYLAHGTARNGLFLWGNHYYYDSFKDSIVRFKADETPVPVDFATEEGDLHELRPIPPPWAWMHAVSPEATERCIRAMGERHLFDPASGGFNRHADQKKGCAFLESGGILIEALCFLYAKTHDQNLLDTAWSVLNYSRTHSNPKTGLYENNPTQARWDKVTATTEIGLWAGCLLRAGDALGDGRFLPIAKDAVDAYLRYGWDAQGRTLYGRLDVATGAPLSGPKETLFQPGTYASAIDPIFPAHDYPYAFLETCLELFRRTGDSRYREPVAGWLEHAQQAIAQAPVLYAEHLGRMAHLCAHAARVLGLNTLPVAESILDRAFAELGAGKLLLGHTGADAYYAVDGVGYLLLACLYCLYGEPTAETGFAF